MLNTGAQGYVAPVLAPVQGVNAIAVKAPFFIKSDGTVWCWNPDYFPDDSVDPSSIPIPFEVPGLASVTDIDFGNYKLIAATADGAVVSWNKYDGVVPLEGFSGIRAISAGNGFVLGLRQDGTVWGWGSNQQGQLGADPSLDWGEITAVQINGLSGIKSIAAGGFHGIALGPDRRGHASMALS